MCKGVKNGSIELNYEQLKELRICYRNFYPYSEEEEEINRNMIDIIKIGWTNTEI
jgi:hypothetical protein